MNACHDGTHGATQRHGIDRADGAADGFNLVNRQALGDEHISRLQGERDWHFQGFCRDSSCLLLHATGLQRTCDAPRQPQHDEQQNDPLQWKFHAHDTLPFSSIPENNKLI